MKKENNASNNKERFAEELSTIIGKHIGVDHIHPAKEGRFYYIQAPEVNSPMLLNHYRGPFFVDIHPDDFEKISTGEISAHDYIFSANWQIGYFWGGGSMIGGGYYQPFDIVNRSDEVKRYFDILSCRGTKYASGYRADIERCNACLVENCPFSRFKKGSWENELSETDPRKDFFYSLCSEFENHFPGFSLKGFLCTKAIPEHKSTIFVSPNGHYDEAEPFTFIAYASEDLIRSLMMRKVVPTDWAEYAKGFNFIVHEIGSKDYLDATEESIHAASANADYAAKLSEKNTVSDIEMITGEKEDTGILTRLCDFFKNLF